VILFDANLAGTVSCRRRCRRNDQHFCVHRFGKRTRVLKIPVEKRNASDMDVVRYFLSKIDEGIPGASITRSRWIIVTRDKGFWGSVQHMYQSANRPGRKVMDFCKFEKRQWIWTHSGDQPVCIEVVRLSSKRGGTGTLADLQRALDGVTRALSQSLPAAPPF
jgi:hypothetical protein